MLRIRQVRDAAGIQNQLALAAVLRFYREAFPDDKGYCTRIADLLNVAGEQDLEVLLLVAEGHKNRQLPLANSATRSLRCVSTYCVPGKYELAGDLLQESIATPISRQNDWETGYDMGATRRYTEYVGP